MTPRILALFAAQPVVRTLMDLDHGVEHWSEFDRGGRCPATEMPDLLVGDVRDFFRNLR
jgi:epoxide hydrolase